LMSEVDEEGWQVYNSNEWSTFVPRPCPHVMKLKSVNPPPSLSPLPSLLDLCLEFCLRQNVKQSKPKTARKRKRQEIQGNEAPTQHKKLLEDLLPRELVELVKQSFICAFCGEMQKQKGKRSGEKEEYKGQKKKMCESCGTRLRRCGVEGCGRTANMWVCLSCGFAHCGRPHLFDPSLGGAGHAIAHYQETGHPCSAKVGTLQAPSPPPTSQSSPSTFPDVFCYRCSDMIEDPFLAEHLLALGLDLSAFEKCEPSNEELEMTFNWRS